MKRSFLLFCLALLLLAQGCAPVQAVPVLATSANVVVAAPAGAVGSALREAVKVYEQDSGLKVQVETLGTDLYADQVTAYLLAGRTDYDLVFLAADELPRWASYHAVRAMAVPPADQEALQPWLSLVMVGGEVMGLPTQVGAEVLWYRADLFEQAGLKPPQTWQEFEKVARYFDEQGGGMRGAAVAAGLADGGAAFAPYLTGFCAPQPAWECDRQTQRQALELYRRLAVGSLDGGRDSTAQALRAGQAAMAVLPLTDAKMLLDCSGEVKSCAGGRSLLAWSVLPGLGDQAGTGSLGAWVVPLNARHPEAGKTLAQWLVSAEGAKTWALNGGLPAYRGIVDEPQVGEKAPYLGVLSGMQAYLPGLPAVIHPASLWNAYHAMAHAAAGGADSAVELENFFHLVENTRRRDGYP